VESNCRFRDKALPLLSPPQSPKRYFRDDNSEEGVLALAGALCASADATGISARIKHNRMFCACAQNLQQQRTKASASLQRLIAARMNERLRLKSTCSFFMATRSKALALPNARPSAFCSMHVFFQCLRSMNWERNDVSKSLPRHRTSRFWQPVHRAPRGSCYFKNRNFVPTSASNPCQAHKQGGSQALPAASDRAWRGMLGIP